MNKSLSNVKQFPVKKGYLSKRNAFLIREQRINKLLKDKDDFGLKTLLLGIGVITLTTVYIVGYLVVLLRYIL